MGRAASFRCKAPRRDASNRTARRFAASGGHALIVSSCLDCHPEPSRSELAAMLRDARPKVYTIEKRGQRKLIFQAPWYEGGEYAGFYDMTIDLPDGMPHHVRDRSPTRTHAEARGPRDGRLTPSSKPPYTDLSRRCPAGWQT